jgi:hypothetical protein
VLSIVFPERPVLTGVSWASEGSSTLGSAATTSSGLFSKRPAAWTAAINTFRRAGAVRSAASREVTTSANVRSLIDRVAIVAAGIIAGSETEIGRGGPVTGDDIGRLVVSGVFIWEYYQKVDGTV